ncbi:Steccherinum Ochraceum laccase obtained By multi crystals composite data collection technique [Lactifluus volemus]|nr:Steccherinum Ochraceum laccase obtained By multi crystals composite data collection technique [Lactifluus volemus]
MIKLLSFLLLLASASWGVSAEVVGPGANLRIVNANIAPDGFPRDTVLADGVFPGPLIRGHKDTMFTLNVMDELTDSSMDLATSIHWHGFFQQHTNYADGPAFVTQCPIVPEHSFMYDFKSLNQAGTFWYHSHFRNQYCDGLRGPLVVYDREDPHGHLYDVDNESTVITLADWYHYLSTNPPPGPPHPSSTLINGKGRYAGGPEVDFAVINVKQGKRYRFRLVSISCDPNLPDGISTQPLLVDSIQIFAGQRYSFVLKADQPVDNYWIRSLPQGESYTDFTNLAVLHYDDAPEADPTVDPTTNIPKSSLPLIENNLHPLKRTPVPGKPTPGGADINIKLQIGLGPNGFTVNGVSFEPPSVPVLLQILNGTQKASDLLPAGSVYGLEANKSVEITIPAFAIAGPHPIHLHGHAFHVVRSAGNTSYNFDDPVIRDVVSIGTGPTDNVTIRFFTDNPGPWFLHCHIDWHLNAGLAVVFAEGVPEVSKEDIVTDEWRELCPIYNKFINASTAGDT